MPKIRNYDYTQLGRIPKALANRIFTDMQLIFSKYGGKITKKDLLSMTLEDFVCICVQNRIQIELK